MSTLPTTTNGASYVEWSAIFAGSVLACAISVVLVQFGNSLGLTFSNLRFDGDNNAMKLVTIGIWLLWVQLMASMAGGYLAGRMRAPMGGSPHEGEVRDGAHGLLVWASSTLAVVAATAIAAALAAWAKQAGMVDAKELSVAPELARNAAIIFGFATAASSVASGVAAWWMGTVGGDHRDRSVDVSRYISFRRK